MVGSKLLKRLRIRLRRNQRKSAEFVNSSSSSVERAFSLTKVRKLIVSYQDGTVPGLWFAEDGNTAAELGHLGLMKDLTRTFKYSSDAMDRAAKRGRVDILQVLWRQGQGCNTMIDGAAKGGHLQAVIWLHSYACAGATKAAMDWAAANGHLSVVKWLHYNRQEGCTVSAINWAAEEGHLDVIQWLHDNRGEGCTTAAFDRAAMNNHVHVVTWLMNHRPEGGTVNALQWAIGRGHTQLVGLLSQPKRTAQEEAFSIKEVASWRTASTASFDTEMTISSRSSSSQSSSRESLTAGGASMLGARRLRFGCSKFSMDKAAQGGHLDVLKLLHEQGHCCTTNAIDWAAAFGQIKVVQWLSENRTEGCTTDAMDHAAANGHFDIVRWLHHNRKEGCTRYALTDAAGSGHLHTVKWLHRHRNDGSRRAMDTAAANGHVKMVRWLHRNRSEGCSREAMEKAARNGHLVVVQLLHEIGAPCTATAVLLAELHGHTEISDFLRRMHPGKLWSTDFAVDEFIQQERDMLKEERKRNAEVEKEAQRRKLSVALSSFDLTKSFDGRNKRRTSSSAYTIVFGHNGKPTLSRIDTLIV